MQVTCGADHVMSAFLELQQEKRPCFQLCDNVQMVDVA